MNKIVTATEARIHFGEIMRQAQIAPIVVERGGEPTIVILSKQEYDRLANADRDWRVTLAETHQLIRETLQDRELPDPVELIRKAREIRDEQIADALR